MILVYALYRPSFIIDAYTRRLLARLGGDFSGDAALRRYFTCALPPDARLFGRYHWLILDHCTTLCRKTPACAACPLRDVCREGSPGLTPDNGTPS